MNDQSYTISFLVDQTPEDCFSAINNVQEWWRAEPGIEGDTKTVGDVFTYRYGEVHYSKQKITELLPNKKVVWLVLDADLTFTKDKAEWKDTEIIFDISQRESKTEVRFTHKGLVPQFECFDKCSNAWGAIINGSLKSLITMGKGQSF